MLKVSALASLVALVAAASIPLAPSGRATASPPSLLTALAPERDATQAAGGAAAQSARALMRVCLGPARIAVGGAAPVRLSFGGPGCGARRAAMVFGVDFMPREV